MKTKAKKTAKKVYVRGPYNKTKKQIVLVPESKASNPFEIMTDVVSGRRGTSFDPNLSSLVAQVDKLEAGNKNQSVNIPTTLYPTKNDALNLVRVLKHYYSSNKINIVLTIKTIVSSDNKKSYLGTRIFRIK